MKKFLSRLHIWSVTHPLPSGTTWGAYIKTLRISNQALSSVQLNTVPLSEAESLPTRHEGLGPHQQLLMDNIGVSPTNPVLATSPSRQCPDRSPTGNQIFLFFFYVIYILCSHFYVGSMYDEIRLHVAWSYNASADSSFSLIPSFTLSNHLLLGLSPNFFAPLIRSFLCPVYQCRPYQRHLCLPVDRQVHFPVAQHSRHFLPVFPPALHPVCDFGIQFSILRQRRSQVCQSVDSLYLLSLPVNGSMRLDVHCTPIIQSSFY